ncbi:MAG TPA: hypothetical protein VIH69_04005 [Dehalococcoidia bacterium]
MALDPTKPLDINAIEATLDELLEHYRQALRAVELLPTWGHVPNREYLVEIAPPFDQTMSHFVVRGLVRMFLRSHIQSKLRAITDHLQVERFASGHRDANTSKRLGDIIRKLRAYDKCLAQRKTLWLRLLGWIWPVAAPMLSTYLTTLFIPGLGVVRGLGYIVAGLIYFASVGWFPLFIFVGLGGFSSKRLILLGQTGDMSIGSTTDTVLNWVPMPQANTYEAEDRLFGTLGLPKPEEFPWDVMLAPPIFLLTSLALAFFMLALDFSISARGLGWPILIAVVLLGVFFFCLCFVLRSISRAKRERRQHSAC